MSAAVRRALILGAFCLAFLSCWALSFSALMKAEPFVRTVGLRYAPDTGGAPMGITLSQWERVRQRAEREETPLPDVTLWAVRRSTGVASDLRASFGDWIICDGNASAVLPVGFLRGNAPARNDGEGCAVSTALAEALWGSGDVVGRSVTVDQRKITVRGIFPSNEPLFLTQAAGETGDTVFSQAELTFADSKNGEASASAFLTKWALPSPSAMVDGSWYALLLGGIVLLPAMVLAVSLLFRLLARVWRVRSILFLSGTVLLGGALLFTAVLLVLGLFFPFPGRLIPSMWSDFSFWDGLWKEFTANLQALFSMPLSLRERAFFPQAFTCAAVSLAASGLLCAVLAKLRMTSGKQLLVWGMLAAVAAFLFVLRLPAGAETVPAAFWLTLPIAFAVDWILQRWDSVLTGSPQKEKEVRYVSQHQASRQTP